MPNVELKKHEMEEQDIYYTEDVFKEFGLNLKEKSSTELRRNPLHLEEFVEREIITNFLRANNHFPEFLSAYSKIVDAGREAVLFAHGNSTNNRWMYTDGKNFSPVQRWINSVDGKYDILYLFCCNPGNHEIRSKKSAVIHPIGTYSGIRKAAGYVQIELYAPGLGYVNPYTIEYDTRELLKRLPQP